MTTEAEPLGHIEDEAVAHEGKATEPSDDEVEDVQINVTDAVAQAVAWEQKATEAQARLLRMQADFDNFRRRTRQEREELTKYAVLPVVTALLPVIDNFQRALARPPGQQDHEAWVKGIAMIYTQFDQLLQQQGVEKMNSVGQPFDPSLHEAIGRVPASETYPAGTVAMEVQPGYRLHDRIVRPAVVQVAQEEA